MADSKRVVVTGATGLIGRKLSMQLAAKGYSVVVFSRNAAKARAKLPEAAEFVNWTPAEQGAWAGAIDGAYAVINLAGANNFAKRWNDAYKQEIYNSRIIGTRGLVNAMRAATDKPSVFISGSAIGYYGMPTDDRILDEQSPPGDDFLANVVKDWEREARNADELGIRTVLLRTGVVIGGDKPGLPLPITLRGASLSRPGVVLDFENGALPLMALPFHLFAGGPIGSGRQWFSWVHIDDVVGVIIMALENERASGPINATAPEAQTNREFSNTLGRVLNRPSWMPVPGFALKLLLGDVADMLVRGQRVAPRKAQELGYQFKYPRSEDALRNLIGK